MAEDIIGVAGEVARALDDCGVSYSVGGSLASGFSGEPRFTLDIDVVVALGPAQVEPLVARLGTAFYADGDAIARAVRERSSVNLIHLQTEDPTSIVYFHSHEDILLQKLRWFRAGGEVSDRQWRDVLAIAKVRGLTLDSDYLVRQAAAMSVTDLLHRLWLAADM